jgi:hypothetical protein
MALMRLVLLMLLLPAYEAASHGRTSSAQRRRLLMEHTGAGRMLKKVAVSTELPSGSKAGAAPISATAPRKRSFKMAFYDRLDSSRTQAEKDYIMNKLMPATASILGRSLRVCRRD